MREGAAHHALRGARAVPEPLVERDHSGQPRLVRCREDAQAVRLRPPDLRALDRGRDAPSARAPRDGGEAVVAAVAVDLEGAVAEDGGARPPSVPGDEERLPRGRGAGPPPPRAGEAPTPGA